MARAFEPPSICNEESAGVVKLLMNIKNPSKEVINSIQNAVQWFAESKILNTRVKESALRQLDINGGQVISIELLLMIQKLRRSGQDIMN